MIQGREPDLCYQLSPQDLVVTLDLASAPRMIWLAEDGPDVILGQLCLELRCCELPPVVQIDLSRNPSLSDGPPQRVDGFLRALVAICSGLHPETGTAIHEAHDVDLPLA